LAWSDGFSSAEEEGVRLGDPYQSDRIDWGVVPSGYAFRATLGLVGAGTITATQVAKDAAQEVAWEASRGRSGCEPSNAAFEECYAAEQRAQCQLLRDLFPNPFRPLSFNPSWSTPNVIALSEVAYQERLLPSGELDVPRLAVLADALEDAGCTDADILNHLRGPGPHVRGCWVVDLLLEKK
jgi:hypothetical protein